MSINVPAKAWQVHHEFVLTCGLFLRNPAKDSRHAGYEFTEAATLGLATFTAVKDTKKYGCDAGIVSVKLQPFIIIRRNVTEMLARVSFTF